MRITVNLEKRGDFFSSGLVSDRVVVNNIFKYFLWSFASRGQRLRALFLFSCCCFQSSFQFSFLWTTCEGDQVDSDKGFGSKKRKEQKSLSKYSSVISIGVSATFRWSQLAVRGGSPREPECHAAQDQRQTQPARPACTNIITAANAQNVMKWPVWLPCVGWTPRRMEESGKQSPMDTRQGTEEARPYPHRPQGEVETWEADRALWGEVRARSCLEVVLGDLTQRASPKGGPKSTATTLADKADGGPSAPAPTGSGTIR